MTGVQTCALPICLDGVGARGETDRQELLPGVLDDTRNDWDVEFVVEMNRPRPLTEPGRVAMPERRQLGSELNSRQPVTITPPSHHRVPLDDFLDGRNDSELRTRTSSHPSEMLVLRNKAELEGLDPNNQILDVINIIAENIHSNIRELEGAFIRVVAYANLTNSKITSELAKEVLKDVFKDYDEDIDPETIRKKVCEYYNVKISDIDSKTRKAEITLPRQIAMYLCRELTDIEDRKSVV